MNIGIFITARLGSTRLARKHLLPVAGQPIMQHLLARIGREFRDVLRAGEAELVITTSEEADNGLLEQYFSGSARVFYGAPTNIPMRHLEAARAHGVGGIIAVDGDDILCSVAGMRAIHQALGAGAQYVKTAGLPFGMNSMGYRTAFLERCMHGHETDVLETGWGRVFEETALENIRMPVIVDDPRLRFTLDYPEDYRFFCALADALGDRIVEATDEEVVRTVLERRLYEITEPISQTYWQNFHHGQESERQQSHGTAIPRAADEGRSGR